MLVGSDIRANEKTVGTRQRGKEVEVVGELQTDGAESGYRKRPKEPNV